MAATELATPARKRAYNRRLFAVVAPRYDLITRMLSFGRDRTWKRLLVRKLPRAAAFSDGEGSRKDRSYPVVLDLACGTGDITFLLAERYPRGVVTGLDLSPEMLARARRRFAVPSRSVRFIPGDMNSLDLVDESVDIVTGGYALRNAPDLEQTLREARRVLRPGGTAAFLEFSLSPRAAGRAVQLRLLRFWGQLWGRILHGDPEVYAYIARSLASFPDRPGLERLLRRTGFEVLRGRTLMLGFARITRVRRL